MASTGGFNDLARIPPSLSSSPARGEEKDIPYGPLLYWEMGISLNSPPPLVGGGQEAGVRWTGLSLAIRAAKAVGGGRKEGVRWTGLYNE